MGFEQQIGGEMAVHRTWSLGELVMIGGDRWDLPEGADEVVVVDKSDSDDGGD